MSVESFLDTNLFICQLEARDKRKSAIADAIIRQGVETGNARISYRYGFYDSLIIAAALEAGCTRLLTEDMQDGQRIETLTIENPFPEGR